MPLALLQSILRSIIRSAVRVLIYCTSLKSVPSTPQLSENDDLRIRNHVLRLVNLREEVSHTFKSFCDVRRMLSMSNGLKAQYREKLQNSNACMLPSFCSNMPSGQEKGTYLALDVGGSTFRVALVELYGRSVREGMKIKRMTSSIIDEKVRRLPSTAFFDWMASNIEEMLKEDNENDGQTWSSDSEIPLGVTWSFPVEQTSHRSGKMQGMGKGFKCHQDTIGKDLAELIEVACTSRGFKVRVEAIVNDGSATLLSQAYLDPDTTMGMILGTGTNAAAFLPVASMGKSKFGGRDAAWFTQATSVVTNTEWSMFSKGIIPETRWDEKLNTMHPLPDFQPLEYKTTGRYLGEIFRLIIAEAVDKKALFDGVMPKTLLEPYSLDTAWMAKLEQDNSANWMDSAAMIQSVFGLKVAPTKHEVEFLRTVSEAISQRASAIVAVAIHSLCSFQKDHALTTTDSAGASRASIACNGSVILKYPSFKKNCEEFLSQLIIEESYGTNSSKNDTIILEPTHEAAVFGAAVAVALSRTTK